MSEVSLYLAEFLLLYQDTRLQPLVQRVHLFRVSGVGFQVSGYGFRVSSVGFQVSGFGFRLSGSRFRVLNFGFRVSGLRFQVFVFRVPGFGISMQGAGSGCLVEGLA